jgi:2,4-dienoyl-CoA reductase-like NADH-dependent reductase (Old Yellow Enzyme family)
MDDEAIGDCVAAYSRAAALAMRIGFDAVEIHGAHGFLIDQFFWESTNLRTDRWGGPTIGDRTRFAAEVVRAVRSAIGADVALFMKISQLKEQDYTVKLATNPDELLRWLGPLRDAGVDVFDCSQRRFWEPEFPDSGSDLNLAGWVKRELSVPTITLGSVGLANDAMAFFGGEAAERDRLDELVRRFERGDFDLVGVARSILADPDWVRTARSGALDDLLPIDVHQLDLGLDL